MNKSNYLISKLQRPISFSSAIAQKGLLQTYASIISFERAGLRLLAPFKFISKTLTTSVFDVNV